MSPMDLQWDRLGAEVAKARKALKLTQPQLGELIGVSRTVIQNIEGGKPRSKIDATMRELEAALRWKRGSVEAILDGGEPVADAAQPVNVINLESSTLGGPELPMRIAQALAEGATLDTTIVPLSPDAQMVVIVKGKPNADPARLRAALEDWERKEGYLRRLGLTPVEPEETDED